jgi:starch synthase
VQTRAEDLSGLLNGVDTDVWNPATDTMIPARYSSGSLAGKRACRAALLAHCGFEASFTGPIFGMICRLTEQKGVDLVLANARFFTGSETRLIILGTGNKRLEGEVRELVAQAPRKVFMCSKLDEAMSHLIEAGSDFFLMPSLFEPCGLNQMYSQGYGTVPIVSRVGGLVDTVTDFGEDASGGTGLLCEPNAEALGEALGRAAKLFANRSRYAAVQQRGMARDFSWKTAAAAYEALYRDSL